MLKINQKGFTLIELLLVVVIMGLMLAVIVPRAWRANIDAKYGLVRQNCSELASFGQEWAENQILAQNESFSVAVIDDYLASLAFPGAAAATSAHASGNCEWVASQTGSNWSITGAGGTPGQAAIPGNLLIPGRRIAANTTIAATIPEITVEGFMPPEKVIRNPFNEVNVFTVSNDPVTAANSIVGSIACATFTEGAPPNEWHYYAFLFQGTDSTTIATNLATSFFGGQDTLGLQGLKNGVFFARVRP